MELQRRLAAQALKCGERRVKFTPGKEKEIKEAITSFDVRRLIKQGVIRKQQEQGISRARAKARAAQRRKGRQRGHGTRKGKAGARERPKDKWMRTVRAQRELLRTLREKGHISTKTFQSLYAKTKGGFFRSRNHIKLYIKEHNLIKK